MQKCFDVIIASKHFYQTIELMRVETSAKFQKIAGKRLVL
jgi:hypothetical protein